MGRKLGSKNKSKSTTKIITKTKNTNTNINNVHVHVEKSKTRKRRTTKPKETNTINPLSKTLGESRLASSNLGFHPRGLINNEPQQPTIIQTMPLFAQSSIEIQTSPATPTGHKINQELKKLVNQLHAAHPKSKLHIGTFRSAITKKLRELGVDAAHSTTYINKMRAFYDEIYAASNGIEAAGGVM